MVPVCAAQDQRMEFLLKELKGKRPLLPPCMETTPDVHEVLATFRCVHAACPLCVLLLVLQTFTPSHLLLVFLLCAAYCRPQVRLRCPCACASTCLPHMLPLRAELCYLCCQCESMQLPSSVHVQPV